MTYTCIYTLKKFVFVFSSKTLWLASADHKSQTHPTIKQFVTPIHLNYKGQIKSLRILTKYLQSISSQNTCVLLHEVKGNTLILQRQNQIYLQETNHVWHHSKQQSFCLHLVSHDPLLKTLLPWPQPLNKKNVKTLWSLRGVPIRKRGIIFQAQNTLKWNLRMIWVYDCTSVGVYNFPPLGTSLR